MHDKLDRKKTVETHNSVVQQTFSRRMDDVCSHMQRSLQEQGSVRESFMDYLTSTVCELTLHLRSKFCIAMNFCDEEKSN